MISNEVLLLKIIKHKGNISMLTDRGLSHSQIALLIQEQQTKGNVDITETEIVLTEDGAQYLLDNLSKAIPRKKDQWILPRTNIYCEPISKHEVILPKGNKI